MPSANLPRTLQRSVRKHVKPPRKLLVPSMETLPEDACDEINERVKASSLPLSPNFDFATFLKFRTYVMECVRFGDFECASLLDTAVYARLPQHLEMPLVPVNRFVIREAGDGKGLGMFAQQDIRSGHTILIEHPAMILPYVITLSTPPAELHDRLLKFLSPSVYQEVTSLSRGSFPTHSYLEDILSHNALGVELEVPNGPNAEIPLHRALFLKTSRCNHSCGPNAKWDWDPSRLTLTMTAVRPIRKNEEITIAYIAPDQPRAVRLKNLEATHGFACKCSYCFAPHVDDILHSDLAREALHDAWDNIPSFDEWCRDPSMADDLLISKHMQALIFIEQEGLQLLDYGPGAHPDLDVGRHLDAIAMCYGALEDVDNFKHWIQRVRAMHTVWQPEQAAAFKKWTSNPFAFPVWGRRKATSKDLASLRKCESVLDLV